MSSEITVEHRAVVIPGEILATGMDYLPGEETYREGEQIRSKVLGLANVNGRVLKVTPLSGPYVPKVDDIIVAKVIDILMSGWRVSTGTPYSAMLNVRDATQRFIRKGEDLSKILEIGDYVVAKISNVTSQNLIDLTMKEPGLFRVRSGRVISVAPQKVPRMIGKRGSMIGLIKRYTGCKIVVGQNGVILLDGEAEKEELASRAMRMIEKLAHHNGLTEKIEDFLKSEVGEVAEVTEKKEESKEEKAEPSEEKTDSSKPKKPFAKKPKKEAAKSEEN